MTVAAAPAPAALKSANANGQLTFDHNGKSVAVPLADLVSWGSPAEARRGPQIVLAGGGLLVADVLGSDEERLTVDSALLRKLTLPLEQIAGIVYQPPADGVGRDELIDRVRSTSAKQDRLILDNGDEVAGTITSISSKEIELKSAAGLLKLDVQRVVALAFDAALVDAPDHRGQRILVGLADGSHLLATSLELADSKARLTLGGGHKTTTLAETIVFLQTLGGRTTCLSDLKPAGYKHIPFLDLPRQYRLDRNVLGGSLHSGGRLYLKGIGMHSASRLTFPLDGTAARFAAEVALDDRAGQHGSVVFRVFVDAEQKYASPIIRGGDAPVPVAVDLPATARSLSLIVDFAERGDELDYANWLHARLEH